ncbi:MAG: DUF1015 domain-containing protein [Pirellulales bacterium]|nr:DUF1015 domain-containing protein [Pirellulales bacterium]
MAVVQAFRGIRYDLGHVGNLADVVAPPYDVISDAMQDELYDRHPANVVRLILNREEPGDDEASNRYQRAAKFFRDWQRQGVMFTESDPALYVYHQEFEFGGQRYTRRGFMARVKLEPFGEGQIYPHEETMSGPKADRLKLTTACQANMSQIFGIYPDQANETQQHLESVVGNSVGVQATDHLGVVHKLWPVTDLDVIGKVTSSMADRPMFIADGHHRYETACNYRQSLADAGELTPEHPANYVLMMCVAMEDPGMVVFPTHRLFRGLPNLDSTTLAAALGDCFTTRVTGEGSDLGQRVWNEVESAGDQGTLGLFTVADERWTLASITDAGREKMASVAGDHGDDWRGLGISLLHRLLLETLLDAKELPKPTYVHQVDEVIEELDGGDEYQLAALVMPPTVDDIRRISERVERMPAKSTYFYPKLLSGLVINPL